MMKNSKLFLCIAMITFASGCSRSIIPTSTVDRSDSTYETIKYVRKDSIIRTPGDTVKIKGDPIPCPDAQYHKTVQSNTGRTKMTVDVNNGVLSADCNTDSLERKIEWLEAEKTKVRELKITTTITHPPIIKTPKWCWWLVIIAAAYLGLRVVIWRYKIPIKL
jgi:hypothetical protein